MTQMAEAEKDFQGNLLNASDQSRSHASSLHPTSDSVSDNDTSERPVREKLKKTSLASISGQAAKPDQTSPTHGANAAATSIQSVVNSPQEKLPEDEVLSIDSSRGRPEKKRSFDELEAFGKGQLAKDEQHKRYGDIPKTQQYESCPPRQLTDISLGGLGETGVSNGRSTVSGRGYEVSKAAAAMSSSESKSSTNVDGEAKEEGTSDSTVPNARPRKLNELERPQEYSNDQEMRDGNFSPRKKRSRDHLDTETDREQKIVATEHARAQRRSDELDRAEIVPSNVNETAPMCEAATASRSAASDNQPVSNGLIDEQEKVCFAESVVIQA